MSMPTRLFNLEHRDRWLQSNKLITDSMNSHVLASNQCVQPVMPDDHSKVVPLLPIPNRTVKRLSADDSADSRVKVGHRQAHISIQPPYTRDTGAFWLRKHLVWLKKSEKRF